jgi:hypothetical protein
VDKTLWNRQALGNGLGKLRKSNPERVELKKKNWKGYTVWVIHPPETKEGEEKPDYKTETSYKR